MSDLVCPQEEKCPPRVVGRAVSKKGEEMDVIDDITRAMQGVAQVASRRGVPARHRAAGPARAMLWRRRRGARPAAQHAAIPAGPVGPSRVLLGLGVVLCGAGLVCGAVNAVLVWGSAGSAVPRGVTPWAAMAVALVLTGVVCLLGQERVEVESGEAHLAELLDEAAAAEATDAVVDGVRGAA